MVDDNPYAPPAADVASPATQAPRRRGWRIYLWLIAVLMIVTVPVYVVFAHATVQVLDLVDAATTSISLVGLFGYAYRRPVFSLRFWIVWLPVVLVWDLSLKFVLIPSGLAFADAAAGPVSVAELAFDTLLVVPLYFALFFYGHRSPEIWRRDELSCE